MGTLWQRTRSLRRWIQPGWRDLRWRGGVITGCLVALFSMASLPSGFWTVQRSYDLSHRLFSGFYPLADTQPVVLVYLDEESHGREKQDPSATWDRRLHAQLLQRLTEAGARRVVFDILFGTPSENPSADEEFRNALHQSGRTLLPGQIINSSQSRQNNFRIESSQIERPLELFETAAAGWGLAGLFEDQDIMVRRIYPGTTQATALGGDAQFIPALSLLATGLTNSALARSTERWVRYYGPALSLPHLSYSQALRADESTLEDFQDRIVLVGARPAPGPFSKRRDESRNPFSNWGGRDQFMPNVEIHATQILNLLQDDWLRRWDRNWEALLLVLTAGLLATLFFRVHPLTATAWALAAEAAVVALAGWAFAGKSLFFPWLIVAAGQIPITLLGSVVFQSVEWYRQKRRFEAERRRAEAKINEQAALIDKAQDAILVRSLDGDLLYANPSAERLYGRSREQLKMPGEWTRLGAPDAAALAAAEHAVRTTGEWSGELTQHTAQGKPFTVESRWTLIRDDQKRPSSILLINTDITEKKQLQQQMEQFQRMETMGSVAGGIAHDLNNALAPVLMGIQLLRDRTTAEEDCRMLDLMEKNTERGTSMVRQVLLFARGQSEERKPIFLGSLAREIETLVRQTFPPGIQIDVTAPPDLWPVTCNSTQIHQVLFNLCINARDAMPDGGHIQMDLDNADLSASEIADIPELRPGRYVLIAVSDTGAGMPPEIRARIFQPFFTTKGPGKGTGLGLSTSLRIIRQHGGELRVTSEPGEGAFFEVLLPATSEADAQVAHKAEQKSVVTRGKSELILVADHEQALRESMAASLIQHGYRVETTGIGTEALARLRLEADPVQVLITGWNLPELPGQQLLELVHQHRPGLPVLVTSNDAPLNPACAQNQPVAVLSKPFQMSTLLQRIDSLLQRSRLGHSPHSDGNK